MGTDPRFPVVNLWHDDEITELTLTLPPYVRVEYVAKDGVVHSETIPVSEYEDLNTFAHKAKWIARALIATHAKETGR